MRKGLDAGLPTPLGPGGEQQILVCSDCGDIHKRSIDLEGNVIPETGARHFRSKLQLTSGMANWWMNNLKNQLHKPLPTCQTCRLLMRLTGIELVHGDATREVFTFECLVCHRIDTRTLDSPIHH